MLITYSLSITIITICYGYYYVLLLLLSITNQDYSLLLIIIVTIHSDYHYVLLSLLFITNSDSFLQSCVLHVNPSLSRKAKSSPRFLNAAWLSTQIPRMEAARACSRDSRCSLAYLGGQRFCGLAGGAARAAVRGLASISYSIDRFGHGLMYPLPPPGATTRRRLCFLP